MKRIFVILLTVCALVTVSCTDYKSQIENLQKEIDDLSANISQLETLTANLGGLRDLLIVGQAGDPIVSATQSGDGIDFLFKNNGTVHVNNKTFGVSVGWDDDFFWTLGGEPLKDASGNNAVITKSPEFRISEGHIEISTDGKKSWKQVNPDAASVISKVVDNVSDITVNFLGNTEVVFPKEVVMQVSLSGDGSTMAANGKASVDFLLSGKTDSYTVTPLLPEGWAADVIWENSTKGKVIFTAPAAAAAQTVRLFFCDGIGNMIASDIDFDNLVVDEAFPVMYPAWEAYSIPEDGGTVSVVLVNNQDYVVDMDSDITWLTLVSTKAVRADEISFKADANDSEQMRSAVITFTAGTYVKTVVIWQEGKPVYSGEDLSANGTANCYIVSKEGDYYFNAKVMGCGEGGTFEGVDFYTETLELFPESVTVYLNQNDAVSNVRLQNNKIYFHATGNKGNVCISIKNDRNRVVWNWHIWCTDVPKERVHTNPDQLQFTVMDRNLGALSSDPADGEGTYGMYYQWGRKDPYVRSEVVANMTANTSHRFLTAILYPQRPYSQEGNAEGNWYESLNDYLWGNPDYAKSHYLKDLKKTIYDPCPLGYMVPPANTFLIFEDKTRSICTDEGIYVHGDYGQINFFPWTGRTYRGFDTTGQELALWHSSAGRWNAKENGGGSQTKVDKATGEVSFYQGDMRARALPVRCVKQVTE